jgi:hypothetical protein
MWERWNGDQMRGDRLREDHPGHVWPLGTALVQVGT